MINWPAIGNEPGIYAIFSFANQEFELLELAESENLNLTVNDLAKQCQWQQKSNGMLCLALNECPKVSQEKRKEIVYEILREFDGQCRISEPEKEPDESYSAELEQLAERLKEDDMEPKVAGTPALALVSSGSL